MKPKFSTLTNTNKSTRTNPSKVLYMTPEGYRKLEQELDYLRTIRRNEVARKIHETIEEGG